MGLADFEREPDDRERGQVEESSNYRPERRGLRGILRRNPRLLLGLLEREA